VPLLQRNPAGVKWLGKVAWSCYQAAVYWARAAEVRVSKWQKLGCDGGPPEVSWTRYIYSRGAAAGIRAPFSIDLT